MKYLKEFKIFESIDDIESICRKYGIKNYTVNDDGSVDVDGNVNLRNLGLTKLPIKFRNVSGDFYCSNNQLISLEGCPQSVGGYFFCDNNQLTSLEGSPQSSGSFYCRNNQLTSLEGSPKSVGRDFYCHNNPIEVVWDLFKDYSKIELLNDYDALREVDGKPTVIIDRLNDFLNEIGEDPVEKLKGWINI